MPAMLSDSIPSDCNDIVVYDLDGTLIQQDSLGIQIWVVAKLSPIYFIYAISILLIRGRLSFKKLVFELLENLDTYDNWLNRITLNQIVLDDFNMKKSKNCMIIIATAAYTKTAMKILNHLGITPDLLIASDEKDNLKGKEKLAALKPYISNKRWIYFGDSKSDQPLFEAADKAFIVKREPNGSRKIWPYI